MSTIAIVPSDVPSKRMLAHRLARLLDAAGHRVVMLVADTGPPTGPPTSPPTGPPTGPDTRGSIEAFTGSIERRPIAVHGAVSTVGRFRPLAFRRASRRAAEAIDLNRFEETLAAVGADLTIIDIEEYEALILALALGERHRWAVLCSFFDVWPIAGLGPDDAGPPTGPAPRMRGAARWWSMWSRMRMYDFKRQALSGDVDRIAVSRTLARRLGVRRRLTARQWLHPFAPRSLPMLVCNALELDVPHQPRGGVHHIGSLLDDPAGGVGELIDDPDLLAAVERARAGGQPLVFCAFGTLTTGERTAMLERLADVARLRPDHRFIVGITVGDRDGLFSELPNVHVDEWLPQRALLAVADAAIVHTGNATLHECVVARVPVVACPLGVNDQRRNAARVVRHGIGLVSEGALDDAAILADKLDRVLGDDDIRRRLDALAGPVARYGRDGVEVAIVESLIDHVNGDAHRRP